MAEEARVPMAARTLGKYSILFDGGIVTQLQTLGIPLKGSNIRQLEASAALTSLTHPDHVKISHEAFALAGVHVLTTNTRGLQLASKTNSSPEDIKELVVAAAKLAREVADTRSSNKRKIRVAACVPVIGENKTEFYNNQEEWVETFLKPLLPYTDIWYTRNLDSSEGIRLTSDFISSVSIKPIWAHWDIYDAPLATEQQLQEMETDTVGTDSVLKWCPSVGALIVASDNVETNNLALEYLKWLIAPLGPDLFLGATFSDAVPSKKLLMMAGNPNEHIKEIQSDANAFFRATEVWNTNTTGLIAYSGGNCTLPESLAYVTGRVS
ncbi:hypothetical protein AAMO2058_000377900 [Amorphochlora amoebiformis]